VREEEGERKEVRSVAAFSREASYWALCADWIIFLDLEE